MENSFINLPDGNVSFCHCPSLLVQEEQLKCVFYAYPESETKKACLAMAKFDGKSWTKSKILLENPGISYGNPVIFQRNTTIFLIYASLEGGYWDTATLKVISSTDDGENFSPPRKLTLDPGILLRHPPILDEDNQFVLPAYREKEQTSLILRSNNGLYWEVDQELPYSNVIQGQIVPVGKSAFNFSIHCGTQNTSLCDQ